MTVSDARPSSTASPVRGPVAAPRPLWRSVAVPAEHGGWGLTLEAVLLGLLVRPSLPGAAIGLAAFLAFVARTPLELALVDRRRHRRLPRTVLAQRVGAAELGGLVVLIAMTSLTARRGWWVPLVGSLPCFAVELSFDVRSRGRRLLPEVSGAVGVGAVAAAIALAGGSGARLAAALWAVLAARAVASVPFARTQVLRVKHRADHRLLAEVSQLLACAVAGAGLSLDNLVWPGMAAVGVLVAWNLLAMRRPVSSAKRVGVLQLLAGLLVVTAAAIGVHLG